MKKTAAALMFVCAFSANAASYEDYARVISVQEKIERTNQRHQVCDGGQAQSSNSIGAGTVIGAVAGGLLGAQVGKGNGRTAAAAVGAATGAMAGNHLENNSTGNRSASGNCYMADDYGTRTAGYNVTYEYQGRTFTESFPNPPNGDTVKVRVNLMPTTARY